MYKIIALFIFTFYANVGIAQFNLLLGEPYEITSLARKGDTLFVATTDGIEWININDQEPNLELLVSGPTRDLLIDGNELYFSKLDNSLQKIDLSDNNNTPIVLLTNLQRPTGLAIKNNYLYYAEKHPNDQISRLDLSSLSQEVMTSFSGNYNPCCLEIVEDELFTVFQDFDKLLKIDINEGNTDFTPIEVASCLNFSGAGSTVNGNYLYIANGLENNIKRLDLTDSSPFFEDVYNDVLTNEINNVMVVEPKLTGIEFVDNDIYISAQDDFSIVGFLLKKEISTSVGQSFNNKSINIYPNPTDELIKIDETIKIDHLSIFDINGKEIEIDIDSDRTINFSKFSSGVYFLQIIMDNQLFIEKLMKK